MIQVWCPIHAKVILHCLQATFQVVLDEWQQKIAILTENKRQGFKSLQFAKLNHSSVILTGETTDLLRLIKVILVRLFFEDVGERVYKLLQVYLHKHLRDVRALGSFDILTTNYLLHKLEENLNPASDLVNLLCLISHVFNCEFCSAFSLRFSIENERETRILNW
jgi:hypothetical protein